MKSDPREQYEDEVSAGARFTVTFWTHSEYGFSVLIGKKDRFFTDRLILSLKESRRIIPVLESAQTYVNHIDRIKIE